jgi:U3 small nucleolar RNA-associated protein 12
LIGTKEGKIEIHEIASGDLVERIDAHTDAIWSLAVIPTHKGLITGSTDRTLKIWNFELVQDKTNASRRVLSLSLVNTIEMNDEVLCVTISQDNVCIAKHFCDSLMLCMCLAH